MVKKELIDIMCCPACKGDIYEKTGKIICRKCGRRYPIKDDIPIMLVEESEMPDSKTNETEKSP